MVAGLIYWAWFSAPKPTTDDAADATAAQQEIDNISIEDLDQQIEDLDATIEQL